MILIIVIIIASLFSVLFIATFKTETFDVLLAYDSIEMDNHESLIQDNKLELQLKHNIFGIYFIESKVFYNGKNIVLNSKGLIKTFNVKSIDEKYIILSKSIEQNSNLNFITYNIRFNEELTNVLLADIDIIEIVNAYDSTTNYHMISE